MAASTRVGNALGAGREAAARLAALASAIVAPIIWLVVAFLLTWPVSQNWLLGLFTTGTDPLLLQVRRQPGAVEGWGACMTSRVVGKQPEHPPGPPGSTPQAAEPHHMA